MKVIFLKDVPRAGRKNEVKEVNSGYALNFLFPNRLAEAATDKAVSRLEMQKKEILVEREVQASLLSQNLDEIKNKTITIIEKANEKGHLFEGIHKKEILAQMKKEHHAEISEDCIILEKPIKEIGEFTIPIEVTPRGGKKVHSSFRLVVSAA
jgi:large subunit ribosomal protein L9